MATQPLIAAKTAAETVTLNSSNYYRFTLMASGLAGAEVLTVTIVMPDGTLVSAKDESGAVVAVSATLNSAVLVGGPVYSIAKPITAGAASVAFAPCSNNG